MDKQKTVLIVEDEKNIVDILRFNLQREGYQTLEAYDGEDGLHTARTVARPRRRSSACALMYDQPSAPVRLCLIQRLVRYLIQLAERRALPGDGGAHRYARAALHALERDAHLIEYLLRLLAH